MKNLKFPTPLGLLTAHFVFNSEFTCCVLVNENENVVYTKTFPEWEMQQCQLSEITCVRETLSVLFHKSKRVKPRTDRVKLNVFGRPCMIKSIDKPGMYMRRKARR